MWQGLVVDGSMASTKVFPLQQYCPCCRDPPQDLPPCGASCMHGVHRPFSVHHAQKQNPPPLQLPDEEMKPVLMTGSTPYPAISPALSPISQTTLPLPPGICQAPLYKLNPSANPPQSRSHHPPPVGRALTAPPPSGHCKHPSKRQPRARGWRPLEHHCTP